MRRNTIMIPFHLVFFFAEKDTFYASRKLALPLELYNRSGRFSHQNLLECCPTSLEVMKLKKKSQTFMLHLHTRIFTHISIEMLKQQKMASTGADTTNNKNRHRPRERYKREQHQLKNIQIAFSYITEQKCLTFRCSALIVIIYWLNMFRVSV